MSSLSFEAQRKAEAAARREEENKRLSQLDSTLAFAEFLRQRKNYTPPDFLKDLLSWGVDDEED